MTTTEQSNNGSPVKTAADDGPSCRSALSVSDIRAMQQDEKGGAACAVVCLACVVLALWAGVVGLLYLAFGVMQ